MDSLCLDTRKDDMLHMCAAQNMVHSSLDNGCKPLQETEIHHLQVRRCLNRPRRFHRQPMLNRPGPRRQRRFFLPWFKIHIYKSQMLSRFVKVISKRIPFSCNVSLLASVKSLTQVVLTLVLSTCINETQGISIQISERRRTYGISKLTFRLAQ